jgi:hypothetical protein
VLARGLDWADRGIGEHGTEIAREPSARRKEVAVSNNLFTDDSETTEELEVCGEASDRTVHGTLAPPTRSEARRSSSGALAITFG